MLVPVRQSFSFYHLKNFLMESLLSPPVVHHLWDPVHRDWVQHHQKNSKIPCDFTNLLKWKHLQTALSGSSCFALTHRWPYHWPWPSWPFWVSAGPSCKSYPTYTSGIMVTPSMTCMTMSQRRPCNGQNITRWLVLPSFTNVLFWGT